MFVLVPSTFFFYKILWAQFIWHIKGAEGFSYKKWFWSFKELLESFSVESATVNYDELGQSVGTADVVTDAASAEEIKSNFAGVALDGKYPRIVLRFSGI